MDPDYGTQLVLLADEVYQRGARREDAVQRKLDELAKSEGDMQELLANDENVLHALMAQFAAFRSRTGYYDEAHDANKAMERGLYRMADNLVDGEDEE